MTYTVLHHVMIFIWNCSLKFVIIDSTQSYGQRTGSQMTPIQIYLHRRFSVRSAKVTNELFMNRDHMHETPCNSEHVVHTYNRSCNLKVLCCKSSNFCLQKPHKKYQIITEKISSSILHCYLLTLVPFALTL